MAGHLSFVKFNFRFPYNITICRHTKAIIFAPPPASARPILWYLVPTVLISVGQPHSHFMVVIHSSTSSGSKKKKKKKKKAGIVVTTTKPGLRGYQNHRIWKTTLSLLRHHHRMLAQIDIPRCNALRCVAFESFNFDWLARITSTVIATWVRYYETYRAISITSPISVASRFQSSLSP
jgi:hypothetical protein